MFPIFEAESDRCFFFVAKTVCAARLFEAARLRFEISFSQLQVARVLVRWVWLCMVRSAFTPHHKEQRGLSLVAVHSVLGNVDSIMESILRGRELRTHTEELTAIFRI